MKSLRLMRCSIVGSGFALATSLLATSLLATVMVSTASASELASVKMRLDWRPGSQHSPFFLGRQLGYFAEEGIDLEIISGSGSSDTVQQVGSEAVEFGLADALVLTQGAQQRVPVKAIASYYQRSPVVVMSPAESPIRQPRDLLNNVRIGHNRGSATSQGLTAMMAANDIRMEDLQLIPIGFGVEPLLAGQVDAMMGFAQNQPIEAELAGMPIHTMPVSDYGVDTYGLMVVTNPDLIDTNRDLVAGFVRATLRGIEAVIADPEAAVQAILAAVDERDPELETRKLAITISYWLGDDGEHEMIGHQTEDRWASSIGVARELGLIERELAPADMFTNEFMLD